MSYLTSGSDSGEHVVALDCAREELAREESANGETLVDTPTVILEPRTRAGGAAESDDVLPPNALAEFIDGAMLAERALEIEELLAARANWRQEAADCHVILRLARQSVTVKQTVLDRMHRLAAQPAEEVLVPASLVTPGPNASPNTTGDLPPAGSAALAKGLNYAQLGDYVRAVAALTAALLEQPNLRPALAARADALRHRGEYRRAIADYTAALALEAEDAEALLGRGQAHQLVGQLDEALADFTAAIEFRPQDSLAYDHRGQVHEERGDLEQAIADYGQALRLDAKNAWAWQARGKALLARGKAADALADFDELVRLKPRFALAFALRGDARKALGQLDRAIDDYTEALQLDPRHVPSLVQRGLARRQKGRLDQAISDFTAALALDPENAELFDQRGVAYRQRGEPERALADFDQALALDPTRPDAFNHRGNIRFSLGQLDEAIDDYTAALRLRPASANALLNRGNALFNRASYAEAIADYTAALELDASLARAWLNRGLSHLRLGAFAKVVTDCSEALRLDAKLGMAWCYRGIAHVEQWEHQDAVDDLTKAIELEGKSALAFNSRGRALSKLSRHDQAVADFAAAIRLEPHNALWHANRAWAFQALEQHEQAARDLASAVTLDPKYLPGYAAQLARWHAASGHQQFAAAEALLALRLDPDNAELAKLRDESIIAAKTRITEQAGELTAPPPASQRGRAEEGPLADMAAREAASETETGWSADSSVLFEDVEQRRSSRKELGSQIWDAEALAGASLSATAKPRKVGARAFAEESLGKGATGSNGPLALDEEEPSTPRPAGRTSAKPTAKHSTPAKGAGDDFFPLAEIQEQAARSAGSVERAPAAESESLPASPAERRTSKPAKAASAPGIGANLAAQAASAAAGANALAGLFGGQVAGGKGSGSKLALAGGLAGLAVLIVAFSTLSLPRGAEGKATVIAVTTASELGAAFLENTGTANSKYAGQLLTVTGKVQSVHTVGAPRVVLAGSGKAKWAIECGFRHANDLKGLQPDQEVTLTGMVELRTDFESNVSLFSCQIGTLGK